MRWLIHLGGPGLLLLGLADNYGVLPGSMDFLTILLAAHRRDLWFYYAIMATIGEVAGGYITYSLARKGGKETLERRFSERTIDVVYTEFERWGFGAVAIPALLPPPFPILPSLLAAGAMQYPRKKFLTALALGRSARFTIVAFLGAHYGRHIVSLFSRYSKPALVTMVAIAVVGGAVAFVQYRRARARTLNYTAGRHSQPKARAA